jgi:pyruvate formate lyase activating enzyme
MEIKGFIETSLIDWDGKLVSVFFLPGCNFRCPFCHNHQLWKAPQKVETVPWQKVSDFLKGKKGWIDGVVITGGEPTVHADLPEFIESLREMGLLIKLDTNGANPEMLQSLIDKKLVDYVAMDLKASLDTIYSQAAGTKVNLDDIKRSIEIPPWFRYSTAWRTSGRWVKASRAPKSGCCSSSCPRTRKRPCSRTFGPTPRSTW